MAQNRRQPRRPGVVYGPPRQGRYSENGVFIGRLLGLGILLLTLGVLAAGTLAFVGDLPAATATPRRSAAVEASISFSPRTASPTVISTPVPTLPPPTQPPPTAAASIDVTFAPPPIQIGEGFVAFGTEIDDQFHIVDPRASFAATERIVWSAYLTRAVNSADLLLRISKLDFAAEGGERVITEHPVTPIVRGVQILGDRIRPEDELEGPGIYVVRYVRADDILSEGSFEVAA
ncbi:MAG: hypothetical protein ABIP53_01660 [Candidatus Limnocylindrales bacterium]